MKQYIYLIRRVRDGALFCAYGNFKVGWCRPSYLFPVVDSYRMYAQRTPFDNIWVKHISCDCKYDSHYYHVIRQEER